MHNIDDQAPPTMFITGDKDQYTPTETAQKYSELIQEAGGRCDLVVHEGGVHGSPFAPAFYQRTLREMDRFLTELGFLPGPEG